MAILAKIHELDIQAAHYTYDLKIAYQTAIQKIILGEITYREFLDRIDTIQDEYHFRLFKALNSKWVWF